MFVFGGTCGFMSKARVSPLSACSDLEECGFTLPASKLQYQSVAPLREHLEAVAVGLPFDADARRGWYFFKGFFLTMFLTIRDSIVMNMKDQNIMSCT